MPHSVPVPYAGFQALILCGPGLSLNTFTSNPEEFPKALIPIANRPMVWYPLDWCYRMGITNITLITPPASRSPLEAALSQNPHLTSLPSPSPSILAPPDLTLTTGTAELLRLPEVQACIESDFLLLPCDLICDVPGESLLEAWMVTQGALDGRTESEFRGQRNSSTAGLGGEKGGRRGGLGVWYQTKGREESIKGEITDFVATAPLDEDEAPLVRPPFKGPSSLRSNLSKLVYAMPMDTLKTKMEENKGFLVRHSLLNRHGRVKMLTTYRDAHIYVLPYWVKLMAKHNEKFESVSEDLIGWWAKSEWQGGLGEKLGLREILESKPAVSSQAENPDDDSLEEEIDLEAMSTTKTGNSESIIDSSLELRASDNRFATRVKTTHFESDADAVHKKPLNVPSILAYIHSSTPSTPLIRRVDSSALLLSVSLNLAKLDSVDDVGRAAASPFAHQQKVAHPAGIAQRCTVTKADCLLGENVTVEEKCVVKECIIGANCHIASGARLTRCLLMDGVVIGERCQLTGCIIGRRSQIGRESVLKDCEVQDGNVVPEETDAKNEKFMIFEGLDDGEMDESADYEGDDTAF